MQSYAPLEAAAQPLPDERLRNRLTSMVDRFSQRLNCSIPEATGTRKEMEPVYDFFKNRRVSPSGVVASSLADTLGNLRGCTRVLTLQDATDLNYSSLGETTGLGQIDGPGGRGLKLHSTLAVRDDGQPAGLLTQQVWAREPQRKGKAAQRRQREAKDKESYRWQDHAAAARRALPEDLTIVHIADREGDIYDWLAAPRPAHAHLLVRVAQAQRVVVHGPDGVRGHLAEVIRAAPVLGTHTLEIPRADDRPARDAPLTLRLAAMNVQPPRHAKQRSRLAEVPVWVIEALEEAPPEGTPPVCWRLVTTEPIETWEQTLRALREYALRWLIERLHFILKSGCRVEQLQLAHADRLANAVAVYSQVAARVLRLTYRARLEPEAPADDEFSNEELDVLRRYRQEHLPDHDHGPLQSIGEAVYVLARIGGYLGRRHDGPPGAQVIWRGLRGLHDLVRGYRLAHAVPPSG
jgi:hypothetical protein